MSHNHHFVSQFYLRNFSFKRKKNFYLHVLDLDKKSAFNSNIKSVGSYRDFNKVYEDGIDTDHIEKALSKDEFNFSRILKQIISELTLPSSDDFDTLLFLIGLFYIHNPFSRQAIEDSLEHLNKVYLQMLVSKPEILNSFMEKLNLKHSSSLADIKDFVYRDAYSIKTDQTYLVKHEIESIKNIVPCLKKMNWILFYSIGDDFFITSDSPVILLRRSDNFTALPLGLCSENTEIFFPISKNVVLKGTTDTNYVSSKVIEINSNILASINTIIMSNSKRQIYSYKNSFSMLNESYDIIDSKAYFKF